MTSEWMKVMLDEIERKKTDVERSQMELKRRREEQAAVTPPRPIGSPLDGPPGG